MNSTKPHSWPNRHDSLLAVFLFTIAITLSISVHRWFEAWEGNRNLNAANPLALLLGDGRKLFANHFFVKADAYFHSGFYPSVFDNNEAFKTPHMAEDAGAVEGRNQGDEHEFLGGSRDWVEQFGRRFFPSTHTHLDQGGPDSTQAGSVQANSSDGVREILPWIKLSAELDPEKIETYVVASFWLRQRMGRVDEAEKFLRQGLRANPQSFAILFELGRIAEENKHDDSQARNLWELGLRYWDEQESEKKEPDNFLLAQLSSRLATLEERTGCLAQALRYMKRWKETSPAPETVQGRIDELLAAHPELMTEIASVTEIQIEKKRRWKEPVQECQCAVCRAKREAQLKIKQ